MILCIFVLLIIALSPFPAKENVSQYVKCRSEGQDKNGSYINRNTLCEGVANSFDNFDSNHEGAMLREKRLIANSGCVLPPYPEHGTYEVENVPEARPGQNLVSFALKVRCRRGFGVVDLYGDGGGTQKVYCINGQYQQDIPKCVRFCKLETDPSIRHMCYAPGTGLTSCSRYVSPGIIVYPVCNSPVYYSTEEFRNMNCISGVWNYLAECKAECGRITANGKPLAIGGDEAKRGELPWHAAIYRKMPDFTQICGGSLVSNTVVISAAHCFWHNLLKQLPATDFAVAMGKLHRPWDSDDDVDAQKSYVKEIKIPNLFQGATANYQEDIAVLVMATPFNYTTYIGPACLDFKTYFERVQLRHGTLGKVAGWGLTAANGGPSEVLRVLSLPYINEKVCISNVPESFKGYITGDKFCAGYTNGTAVCRGDSGGGLAFSSQVLGVNRYYLRGIVSSAPPSEDKLCNDHAYTIFTKVTRHQKLILDTLAESERKICPPYSFQCEDGSCVDPGSDCNGRQDCADGSDESEELCKIGTSLEETKSTTVRPNSNSECGGGGNINPSIFNTGYSYKRGDIPFLAAIYKLRENGLRFLCAGTLISRKHVITVAHAFRNYTVNNIVVKLGSYNRNDWTDDMAASRKLISVAIINTFDKVTFSNDLAILTLSRRVELTKFVMPACFDNTRYIGRHGISGMFVGWGEDRQRKGQPGAPHILKLTVVNTIGCRASNEAFNYVTSNNTLCARHNGGSNPCVGDSGGGLYFLEGGRWFLSGLLSLTLPGTAEDGLCNAKDYAVFTDVSKYLPWIKIVMSENA